MYETMESSLSSSVKIPKQILVLVPHPVHFDSPPEVLESIRLAQRACRILQLNGATPVSPLLHYLAYMSAPEYASYGLKLTRLWLYTAEKICLELPEDSDTLCDMSYAILDSNEKLDGRKPVFQIFEDAQNDYIVEDLTPEDVRELLDRNLISGFAKYGL